MFVNRISQLSLHFLICLGMFLSSAASGSMGTPGTFAVLAYHPNELDDGLYWFGKDGANQKFIPGEPNSFFDPTRPTLIFVHGWQPFLSGSLPDFDANGVDTAAGWIEGGWNVGVFVWNQFADERTGAHQGGAWFANGPPPQGVLDAEAKIWTTDGPQKMRWYDWDALPLIGGYRDAPPGTPDVGESFYQAYTAAFPQAYAHTIRIAGHSLGNQLAVRLAKLVDTGIKAGEAPESLRPDRVALLDPYWSPGPRDYLDQRAAGEMIREYIAELTPGGTLFEWYWSSNWTTPPQGDANDALKPVTFYAEISPAYATTNLEKHLAAKDLYLWSYAFEGPAPCSGEACLEMTRVLSQMSDDQLAAVLRSDARWIQVGGQDTSQPGDDTYHPVMQSDAPYTTTSLTASPLSQAVGGTVTITATVSAPDGTLVTFTTDLGQISPRAVVRHGLAAACLTSGVPGMAHISATTRGAGGAIQSAAAVRFTSPASSRLYLAFVVNGHP